MKLTLLPLAAMFALLAPGEDSLTRTWVGVVRPESSPEEFPLRLVLQENRPDSISGSILIEWSENWGDSLWITEGSRPFPDSLELEVRGLDPPVCSIRFAGTVGKDALAGRFANLCGHRYVWGTWTATRSPTPVMGTTWGKIKTGY